MVSANPRPSDNRLPAVIREAIASIAASLDSLASACPRGVTITIERREHVFELHVAHGPAGKREHAIFVISHAGTGMELATFLGLFDAAGNAIGDRYERMASGEDDPAGVDR